VHLEEVIARDTPRPRTASGISAAITGMEVR